MGSTIALMTGLTGLRANSRNLEVIGNNIANVNTTAFKGARMLFSTAMSRTTHIGSEPTTDYGGTNPFQVGLGVGIAGTQLDFGQGALQTTGDGRDLAVEGDGFFVVQRGEDRFYTRDGGFRQDAEGNLVSISGERLLGYAVDDGYNIIDGVLTDLNIPLGARAVAESTDYVRVVGNLNASGDLSAGGSTIAFSANGVNGFSVMDGATNPPDAGEMINETSLLTEIEDPEAAGQPMFAEGQVLQINGARRGGATVPVADLTITPTMTVQDMLDFFEQALGVHDTGELNPDGATPGAVALSATGFFTIFGNTGTVNDLEVSNSAVRLLNADGSVDRLPFVTTKTQEATGESIRTTFIVYDSLGQEVAVDLSMVIDSKGDTGTTWRYFLDSGDDTDIDLRLTTGEISFDTSGLLIGDTPVTATLDREGTGAATPLTFSVDFAEGGEQLTALSDDPSSIASTFRNGRPSGTLEDFGIDRDGLISGVFSNGLTRTLGRVVLAKFTNNEGLIEEGSNLFREGPNSGAPAVVTPTSFGTGSIVAGALEQSNVDIGEELTDMIMASTGYSASSRVIQTADELLQQLLLLGR
ncbi:MAG: flagellar hook-basal body complex protein [Planctomycetota bacterium]|nr:flagellar hook-basal body complex protein [Planctomycetota bacterium]